MHDGVFSDPTSIVELYERGGAARRTRNSFFVASDFSATDTPNPVELGKTDTGESIASSLTALTSAP